MRIPFPERVRPSHALIFATMLLVVELLEGTNPYFAGCAFCFILVAAISFNIAGGIAYPSGAFILFNAIFTIALPLTAKAILGQPGNRNLHAPVRTIEVYLCGMVGMFAAAVVSHRFRRRKALLSGLLAESNLRSSYVGSAVFAVLIFVFLVVFPGGANGSFSSFLNQIDRFPVLTFIIGVVYIIHHSRGRRSVTVPLLLMIVFTSLMGLITFSKELFLTPFFAWAITAALMGYRLRWINIVLFVVGMYLTVTFMVPYAQYGKSFVAPQLSRTGTAIYLLTHMDDVRQQYEESVAFTGNVHFYDQHMGLLSRLEVFSVDDALIDVTDQRGPIGYTPLIEGFEAMIPHFLWPNKPVAFYGNTYAHEIGILGDNDNLTGVSFSPSADAYHEGGIIGVLITESGVLILIFLVLDSVIGDVRLNPIGLLMTILISRAASEGALFSTPYLISNALAGIVIVAYICAYALPIIGKVFTRSPSGAAPPALPASSQRAMPDPVTSL